MTKLSERELKLLKHLRDNPDHHWGSGDLARGTGVKNPGNTLAALRRKKLAIENWHHARDMVTGQSGHWLITDAGRAAFAEEAT